MVKFLLYFYFLRYVYFNSRFHQLPCSAKIEVIDSNYNSTSELPGFQHVLKSFLDVKNDTISKEILKKIPMIIPRLTIKEAFDKFTKGETMGERMITDETLVEDDMGEGIIIDPVMAELILLPPQRVQLETLPPDFISIQDEEHSLPYLKLDAKTIFLVTCDAMISYKASIRLKGSNDVIKENFLQSNRFMVVVHADMLILQPLDLKQRKARSGISENVRAKHSIIENKDFQRLKSLQEKSLNKLLNEINSNEETLELQTLKNHRNCSEVHQTCCSMKITTAGVDWSCCSTKTFNLYTPPYGSITSLVQSNIPKKDASTRPSNEYVEEPCKEHLSQKPNPSPRFVRSVSFFDNEDIPNKNDDSSISKKHHYISIDSPVPKPRSLKITKSHSFSPSSFHQRMDPYKPLAPLNRPVPAPRTKFFPEMAQNNPIQEVTSFHSSNTESDQTKDPDYSNKIQEVKTVNNLSQIESNLQHELDISTNWRTPNKISIDSDEQHLQSFIQPCYSWVYESEENLLSDSSTCPPSHPSHHSEEQEPSPSSSFFRTLSFKRYPQYFKRKNSSRRSLPLSHSKPISESPISSPNPNKKEKKTTKKSWLGWT